MRSVVTLSVDVIKGRSPAMSWPRIETPGTRPHAVPTGVYTAGDREPPDALVTVAVATPLEEATRLALRDMILWLEERTGVSKREAYFLVGLAGHARPGQVQVPLYSMRCIMPKAILDSLVVNA